MKSATMFVLALLVLVASCESNPEPKSTTTAPSAPAASPASAPDQTRIQEPMAVPADNPITPEKVELGKQLFFDKCLSKAGNMSCESCHMPEKGWADGRALSPKFDGSLNTRHTPTLYNAGFYKEWYWDGRAATLEGQILAAWRSQMGGDPEQVATALNGIEAYK